VKFAIQELALELVTIIEFDAPMAILEVIMELSLVNILSYLHQSSFSFEFVIDEVSDVSQLLTLQLASHSNTLLVVSIEAEILKIIENEIHPDAGILMTRF
jgi:hypothetical protein